MLWTRPAGLVFGLLALSGCLYGYRTYSVGASYSTASRPDASYYCYDCHGYRYFDPYYDWCTYHGFRYRWADHPRVIAVYRERYVRIKEVHPEYGRYRYEPGYRSSPGYREGSDYEAWRERPGGKSEPSGSPARYKKKPRERSEETESKPDQSKHERRGEKRSRAPRMLEGWRS